MTARALLCLLVGITLFSTAAPWVAAQEKRVTNPLATRPGATPTDDPWDPERLGDGDVVEAVVDDEGKIYEVRHYGGVVPSLAERASVATKARPGGKAPAITWVGFQQRSLFSRVFIQTDRAVPYTIYKPDPLHIYVEFPNTGIPASNDRRRLDTSQFETAITGIEARVLRVKGGSIARVIISLDRPTGYLYKQEGDYVFIDIER